MPSVSPDSSRSKNWATTVRSAGWSAGWAGAQPLMSNGTRATTPARRTPVGIRVREMEDLLASGATGYTSRAFGHAPKSVPVTSDVAAFSCWIALFDPVVKVNTLSTRFLTAVRMSETI